MRSPIPATACFEQTTGYFDKNDDGDCFGKLLFFKSDFEFVFVNRISVNVEKVSVLTPNKGKKRSKFSLHASFFFGLYNKTCTHARRERKYQEMSDSLGISKG